MKYVKSNYNFLCYKGEWVRLIVFTLLLYLSNIDNTKLCRNPAAHLKNDAHCKKYRTLFKIYSACMCSSMNETRGVFGNSLKQIKQYLLLIPRNT